MRSFQIYWDLLYILVSGKFLKKSIIYVFEIDFCKEVNADQKVVVKILATYRTV